LPTVVLRTIRAIVELRHYDFHTLQPNPKELVRKMGGPGNNISLQMDLLDGEETSHAACVAQPSF
jgi:hypothetical protein